MAFVKKIVKKSYFWLLVIAMIFSIVLVCSYSNKIVYNAEYCFNYNIIGGGTSTGAIKFYRNGEAEQYSKYENRQKEYTYIVSGAYIYLLENGTNISYCLVIQDKFTITDKNSTSDLMVADDAKVAFYTILAFDIISIIISLGLVIDDLKKSSKNKTKQP